MNLHPDYLLNRVEEPEDIKTMSMDQLEQLAAEMRTLILERVSTIGGHLGPDLGIVELAIAYHYVFNSPTDKVIWDVSHNSYPHKMLTCRKLASWIRTTIKISRDSLLRMKVTMTSLRSVILLPQLPWPSVKLKLVI